MIIVEDVQKNVVQSENTLAKIFFSSLSNSGIIEAHESEKFEALWEGQRKQVFQMLVDYYSSDTGIGSEAKEKIFTQTLEGMISSYKINKSVSQLREYMAPIKIGDIETDLVQEFEALKKAIQNDFYSVFNPHTQMEAFKAKLLSHGLMVKTEANHQNSYLIKTRLDPQAFGSWLQKTVGEILGNCQWYEKNLSEVFRSPPQVEQNNQTDCVFLSKDRLSSLQQKTEDPSGLKPTGINIK